MLRQTPLEVDDDAAGGLGADARHAAYALDVAVGDGLPDAVAGETGQQGKASAKDLVQLLAFLWS